LVFRDDKEGMPGSSGASQTCEVIVTKYYLYRAASAAAAIAAAVVASGAAHKWG
jgi:hypothetical protein